MRLCGKVFAVSVLVAGLLVLPARGHAVSCTTQAEMAAQDSNALTAMGGRLGMAILGQDYATLQAALLPAEANDWGGIREAVELDAPLVKGGQLQLRNLYLLDASTLAAPADTQFFCSNSSGSLTVTLNMRSLPP